MNITKDMNVAEVLSHNENLVPVFYQHGLFCLGCVLSHGETIEQACMAHGIDCDSLISDLNKADEAVTPEQA